MEQVNSFYSSTYLAQIGFKSIGKNVLALRKVSIYKPEAISIRSNVRINDFCVLPGHQINIKDYIYTTCFHALFSGVHVIVGFRSVILSGVTLSDGAAIGAMSFISKFFELWKTIFGNLAKILNNKFNNFLKLEKNLKGYCNKWLK